MNNQYYPYGSYPAQNTSRIQNISSVLSTEVQCFYVNNPQEMDKINPTPNVLYIGINLNSKEIYLKQVNGFGLIDFDIYAKQAGEQQKNDLTKILEKLDELMKGRNDAIQPSTNTGSNEYVPERYAPQPSDHAAV